MVPAEDRFRTTNSAQHVRYPAPHHDRGAYLGSAYLQEIAEKLKPFTHNVRWGIATGPPPIMIAARASLIGSGLIVITANRYTRWERFLKGNLSEKLWSLTSVPILIIKDNLTDLKGRSFLDPRAFIVPIQHPKTASIVMPFLKSLLASTNAKAALIINSKLTGESPPGTSNYINSTIAELESKRVKVTTSFTRDAVTAMRELQEKTPGSWVITASRSRDKVSRLFLGSFSRKIFNAADSPVVIVPDKDIATKRILQTRKENLRWE